MQTHKNIDDYIQNQPEEFQKPLEDIRHFINTLVPDTKECISYGIPSFKLNGKAFAGFGAYKKFISFYPFSGEILASFQAELTGFECAKSAIHLSPERPLPKKLLKEIILARIAMIHNK